VNEEDAGASSGAESTERHVDRHGRTWDQHPFVQSRAVDNVRVCICGLGPDDRIHQPAPESMECLGGAPEPRLSP
jgi:hypothetical protein